MGTFLFRPFSGAVLGAFRLVFNASALLAALSLAWWLGLQALAGQALPWQSLALGRLLAEAGAIPEREALLFGASQRAFDGLSWGWDYLGAQALRMGGEGLLRGMDALMLGLATLSLAAAAYRRGARPFSSGLMVALALIAARPDLHPGPALAVWAVFCAALWMLEGPLEQALAQRWIWLPPLALLAVNLHAGAWALGLLALLWLAFESAAAPSRWARAGLFLILLLCLLLHPQGPLTQLQAWTGLGPSPLWPGAFEARQGALLFLAFAALMLLASSWVRGAEASQGRDRALLLAFGLLGLASRDALPWALALAAPIAALRFDQVLGALPPAARSLRWPMKVALLGLGLFYFARGPWRVAEARLAEPLPGTSIAFYEQELLNLRIACPPEWTAYLAHRLSPHAAFAVDSRGRAPRAQRDDFALAQLGGADAAAALQRLGAEAAWLPLGSPLASALATAQGWQPVSADNVAVLYLREMPNTRELIRIHAPRGLRLGDPFRPFDPSRVAQAEADLEMRLAREPGLGLLYHYQAELWLARGQDAKARQTLEAGIRADPASAWPYARLAALRAQRGESAEARQLYHKALRRLPRREWREALAALDQP